MNTAKTLLLLDANNNNISPATCVDSLYFEKVDSGVTYRMALKNRIIVASDNMNTTSTIADNPASLESIKLPYFYVTPASGTGNIYQLNTATLNVGTAIKNGMDTYATGYIKKSDASAFLYINGTNHMTGPLNVGPAGESRTIISNNKITFGSSFTIDSSVNTKSFSLKSNDNSSINSITLDASIIRFGIPRGKTNTIYVGDRTATKYVNITSNTSVNISTQNLSMHGINDLSIGSNNGIDFFAQTGNIKIHTAGTDKNISLDSSVIKMYDVSILNPRTLTSDATHKYILSYDTQTPETTTWSKLPTFHISTVGETAFNYLESLNVDTSVFLKRISFTGPSSATIDNIIKKNNSDANDIYFRSLNDSNSHSYLLKGSNYTDQLYFATINGQSILGTSSPGNLKLCTPSDISTFCKVSRSVANENKSYYILSDDETTTRTNTSSLNLKHISHIYYKTDGAVYASAFYANSDERLKTDIQYVDIDHTSAPKAKQFVWKDSSVQSYGFIAQELEAQGYSELVDTDEHGYKKVNYDAALSLSVACLQKENNELRERLNKLERLIEEKLG